MRKYIALFLVLLLCLTPLNALAAKETAPATPTPAPTPKPVQTSELLTSLEDPACKAALLMDAETGTVLYDFHGEDKNYPASITKIMTALLTLEAVDRGELSLDRVVTVPEGFDTDLELGGTSQNLKVGEEISVQELLFCALVASANDACNVLATAVAGDVPSFVSQMNHRAEELGLTGTHFVNAHGLHAEEHYTNARDIAVLTRLALQNENFATFVSTKNHTVPATNLSGERRFSSTNALLLPIYEGRYVYPRAIGVKTGTTNAAGKCLVSAAKKGEQTLICVLLGTEDVVDENGRRTRVVFAESKRLLEWGFDSFAQRTLLDAAVPLAEVGVTLSSDVTAVAVKPQNTVSGILPKDLDPAEFQRDITLYQDSVEAPVKAGQELGEVTVRNGDDVYATVKLVAAAAAERSELLSNLKTMKDFFAKPLVRVVLVLVGVALVLLILRFGVLGKRRSRYEGHAQGYRGSSRRNRR